MIILNKKCETCVHSCVCEKKGLRKMFESELSFFIESFDEEVMSEFDLSNQCKDYMGLSLSNKTQLRGIDFAGSTSRNVI